MNTPIIKVCGMKHQDNIQGVLQAKPDWMGFIFYHKSPRFIPESEFSTIAQVKGVKKVGVFVNESTETILSISETCGLDALQLHGEESVQQCKELRQYFPIIKAISVAKKSDLDLASQYQDVVDYFLFDTKRKGQKGGTGEKFDWEILEDYQGEKPFLLSGGISYRDVFALQSFHHDLCVGYDVNSGFEIEPGRKQVSKVSQFITEIKDV